MPEPDETPETEVDQSAEELRGAAGASAAKKARKERDEAKRELAEIRARFKRLEDAEKSETERLRSELDELKREQEQREAQVTAEREQHTRQDTVRRAASDFADPDDAIAHLSLRGELADIEDDSDAKRALKQLAKDKPYLLKPQGTPQSAVDRVLENGQTIQQPVDPSKSENGPKTGEEMYAMNDEDFLAWKLRNPEAYRQSLEGWTGHEVMAREPTPQVLIRQ